MFEELMHSIWEEFSKLIFHAEVEIDPARPTGVVRRQRRQRPDRARLLRRHARGPALGPAAGGRRQRRGAVGQSARRRDGGRQRRRTEVVETVVKDEHENIGRNDPCWCGSGKKYKKCHGA